MSCKILLLFLIIRVSHARPATEIEIDTLENEDDTEYDNDDEFYQPKNLEAIVSTQTSISLKWDLEIDLFEEPIISDSEITYRIHYMHQNFQDVKTIRQAEPEYTLKGLEPFTKYEIWVESIVNETQSKPSDHVFVYTDVEEPSAPTILNVTCYDTGTLYIEWRRPKE